jgi:acyl-CoA thioesterase I
MPLKFRKFKKKRLIVLLGITFILFLALYLNRSYARIFEYNSQRYPLARIQHNYSLTGGKGDGTLKYAALGDSLTYGTGATTYEETYPYVISKKMLEKYKTVEVTNFAVPGAVSEDVLAYQLPKAVSLNPDYITLMIGTNDVHDYVSKENFRNNVTQIINTLQEKTGAEILLINIPYLGTDVLILPPYNFLMESRIKEYNEILKELASSENLNYFDLYSASYNQFKNQPEIYYSYDQFHPSGQGYLLWGEMIGGN